MATGLYTYDDFQFKLTFGNWSWDKAPVGNGVVIEHDNAQLDNPAYIEALKKALVAYPVIEACYQLTNSLTVEQPAKADDDELEWAIGKATLILEQTITTLPEDHLDIAREVLAACRPELDKRREREQKKVARELRRKTNAPGFVYLLHAPSIQHYKIGHTKKPAVRLSDFGVKLPFAIECLCLIETPDRYALEGELHKRFAEQRVNGEWFILSADDVDYVKSLAVQS